MAARTSVVNVKSGPSASSAAAPTSSFWLLAGITGRSGLWLATGTPSSATTRQDVASSVSANACDLLPEGAAVEVAGDQAGQRAGTTAAAS